MTIHPRQEISLFNKAILGPAAWASLKKLAPNLVCKNPVMFVVEVGAVLTTILWFRDFFSSSPSEPLWFTGQVSLWLWFTVIFANFAEAVAEGRGKAQAAELKKMRREIITRKLVDGQEVQVPASQLRRGDIVVAEAGDYIPGDGDVIEGIASVDESAVTGESAPVIREAGGDRSAVTGGTKVLSDRIVIRISANPGRQLPGQNDRPGGGGGAPQDSQRDRPAYPAGGPDHYLSDCLRHPGAGGRLFEQSPLRHSDCGFAGLPDPHHHRRFALRHRHRRHGPLIRKNVLAMSGRAVEAAGDVDTLLLDKTGTITLGNRMASELLPAPGVTIMELAVAAGVSSVADETPEGRSIVDFVKRTIRLTDQTLQLPGAHFIPFSAHTRMSGCDVDGLSIRKGAVDAICQQVQSLGGVIPDNLEEVVHRIGDAGGTPLAVSQGSRFLGIIHLKDIIKADIKERFVRFRAMGIRTVMITGDNPRTAATIAREAGVDDFLAEATPERKMRLIMEEQAKGKMVAMTGDGTNDAPALAQADVGVAMNTGTQAAKEAGNMIDLDSDPTKLLEVVEVGKQLLMTRGALTTFSVANDVAKYFAILPAMFVAVYPEIAPLNLMGLASPLSAILSAVIFNAVIIVLLIPLSLKGVRYRPIGAGQLLRRLLLFYGVGGIIAPFAGIKLIDLLLAGLGLK